MADAFNQSLVYKTNPDPWHQLLVLSQAMINDAFWNMHALSDPSSPIRKISMRDRGGNTLDAILDAPEVSVNVLNLTPQLWYDLRFKSGSMQLYTSDDPNNNDQKTFDLANWRLVFPVTFTAKDLDPTNPDYKSYLNQMGNPSGVFSLARLFIDSSSAAVYDKSLSDFRGTIWEQEPLLVRSNFATLVDGWFNRMAADGKSLLGISLKTSDPSTVNPNAPSFPPTSINYSSYPWLDPTVSNPIAKNELDQNALVYLIQTGNAAAPSPAVLDYSGCFTDGTIQTPGTVTINRSQFFEQWFLPLLKFLNKASEIQCNKPYAKAYGDGGLSVAPDFTMSYNDKHVDPNDQYFNFIRQNNGSFAWIGDLSTSHADDNAGGSGWNNVDVDEDSRAYTTVTFTPGGQLITVQGGSAFVFRVKQTGAISGPFKTASTFTINLKWHINLALGVVSDGGLQIARIADPPNVDAIEVTGTSSNDGLDWKTPWNDYEDQIRQQMEIYFQSTLNEAENRLIDGLAHQNKLFLPGSGTFLFDSAQINSRGDMVATLHYNGAPPPGEVAEPPDYLSELPPRKTHKPVGQSPSNEGVRVAFPAGRVYPKDPKNREFAAQGPEHYFQMEREKRTGNVRKHHHKRS